MKGCRLVQDAGQRESDGLSRGSVGTQKSVMDRNERSFV